MRYFMSVEFFNISINSIPYCQSISHRNKSNYIDQFKCADLASFDKTLSQYKWEKLDDTDRTIIEALAIIDVMEALPLPELKENLLYLLIPKIEMQTIAAWVDGIARLAKTMLGVDHILDANSLSYHPHYLLELYQGAFDRFWHICLLLSDRVFSKKFMPLAILSVLTATRMAFIAISYVTEKARAYLPNPYATASLSALASNGKLKRHSKMIGRHHELKQMVDLLVQRQNVFLCGPTGSGKTALVEELAMMIQRGEVESLRDKIIETYNGASLGGTSGDKDFQQTLFDSLIQQINNDESQSFKNRIFFIDEIHAASDRIRQALKSNTDGSGDFPLVIIATTEKDACSIIDEDDAFSNRFPKVQIAPLEDTHLIELLKDKYGTVVDNESLFAEVINALKGKEGANFSLRSVLRFFALAHGKLGICDDTELTYQISEEATNYEKLQQQLKRTISSHQNPDALLDPIQKSSKNLKSLKTKRDQLHATFHELSQLSKKIEQIYCNIIREAKKQDRDESFILCAYHVALPALKAKYEEQKNHYMEEFHVTFHNRISSAVISEVFQENYKDKAP